LSDFFDFHIVFFVLTNQNALIRVFCFQISLGYHPEQSSARAFDQTSS